MNLLVLEHYMPEKKIKILIVAGEASGDLHGAHLAREILTVSPHTSICGMGGREMASAGVDILVDNTRLAVMGLVEILGRLGEIRAAMKTLADVFDSAPPDLLILIDYPGFNLALAKKAWRKNIPVLYYISPKIWAWREGRIEQIRKYVTRMAVILPFEVEFYKKHGMAVDFVGNPMLDSVQTTMGCDAFRASMGIEPGRPVVGLLPGSRVQEIARLLADFLRAGEILAQEGNTPVFLLPQASTITREDLVAHGLGSTTLDVRVCPENRYDLMAACDAVLAASGTVTLELAILGVPMVVCYRVAPLTYYLARPFIRVKYASLVNLVAGRAVVPELLQKDAVPHRMAEALGLLVGDRSARERMKSELLMVRQMLGAPGASARCARLALEMITPAGNETK